MISGAVVGFFYLWPLTFLAIIAVFVCLAFAKEEYDEGVLTRGGKQMVRARQFLGISCTIYCLCIIFGVAFKSIDEPMLVLGFWLNRWYVFLALIIGAEISMITAVICGFGTRGSRNWIVRTATVLIALLSTFVTFPFLSPE